MTRACLHIVILLLLVAAGTAPVQAARITLVRGGCFFNCPEFSLALTESGQVIYAGTEHVDIPGQRRWRIPAEDASDLFAIARDPALWATEDRYFEKVYDGEYLLLRVTDGARHKQIFVYPAGNNPDHPEIIQHLVHSLQQATGVERWIRISPETIAELRAEGFDFTSQASGHIFEQAVRRYDWGIRPHPGSAAIVEWLALGAPIDHSASPSGETALSGALRNGFHELLEPLLAREVLKTDGQPDPRKIDAAFQAAIQSGRLDAVKRIWDAHGPAWRPALDYAPEYSGPSGDVERISVLHKLDAPWPRTDWEGLEIVEWLGAQGADLASKSHRGHTMFDLAASADDPAMMRFLLERDLDPGEMDPKAMMRFIARQDEDMVMALLEAHVRHNRAWKVPRGFRVTAELQKWPQVLAWLDAHPEHAPEKPCP